VSHQGQDTGAWKGHRVAVTGATGFLGSHLTARLVELGAAVVVLADEERPVDPTIHPWSADVDVVVGDVRDQPAVERMLTSRRVTTVLHLAAQTKVEIANRDPLGTLDVNVRGTWNVVDAARRSSTIEAVVVASSDKAYGDQPVLPYDEAMPLRPSNPYDVSKACADLVCLSFHHAYAVPVSITRCANVFGPGDVSWDRLIPGTIRALLHGARPVIRSDGTMTRDFLYVDDAVAAYLCLAEAVAAGPDAAGEVFNFSNESPLTVLEVVEMVSTLLRTDLAPDVRATAANEIAHQFVSSAKARQVLHWKPQHSMESGLAETVAWYRDHLRAT
jgi:CDP-glucose 4,6-dehydratase